MQSGAVNQHPGFEFASIGVDDLAAGSCADAFDFCIQLDAPALGTENLSVFSAHLFEIHDPGARHTKTRQTAHMRLSLPYLFSADFADGQSVLEAALVEILQ